MLPREVLEDIRKKVESGLGPLIGSTDEAEGSLKGKAQGAADQLSGFASIVLDWVALARESIRGEVRDLVQREIVDIGLATAKELDALAARVERLERGSAAEAEHPGRPAAGAEHRGKVAAEAAHRGKPAAGKTPGKGKRKARARELDALTVRVERLERAATPDPPSPSARTRTASPKAKTNRPRAATAAAKRAPRPAGDR